MKWIAMILILLVGITTSTAASGGDTEKPTSKRHLKSTAKSGGDETEPTSSPTTKSTAREGGDKTKPTPPPPAPTGADFLKMWQAWNTADAYKYTALSLKYRCEVHNWAGIREVRRKVIRSGSRGEKPFGVLEAMRDINQLHDVKPVAKHKDTYSMVMPNAITLKEGSREVTLPAELICQMDQRRPRRFIAQAPAPKRWQTRKVRMVYTWDLREYDEEWFWIPVEIRIEFLVKRGNRQVVLSEQWTLERILEGPAMGRGPIQPVMADR
jgi:hypothetical protein